MIWGSLSASNFEVIISITDSVAESLYVRVLFLLLIPLDPGALFGFHIPQLCFHVAICRYYGVLMAYGSLQDVSGLRLINLV